MVSTSVEPRAMRISHGASPITAMPRGSTNPGGRGRAVHLSTTKIGARPQLISGVIDDVERPVVNRHTLRGRYTGRQGRRCSSELSVVGSVHVSRFMPPVTWAT